MLVPILAGALLGGLFGLFARRHGPVGEQRLLVLGLIIAAVSYVGLAVARADREWLGNGRASLELLKRLHDSRMDLRVTFQAYL